MFFLENANKSLGKLENVSGESELPVRVYNEVLQNFPKLSQLFAC